MKTNIVSGLIAVAVMSALAGAETGSSPTPSVTGAMLPNPATTQATSTKRAIPTTTIEIRGKATEKPALAYSLMFRVDETRRGNAAVKYLQAAQAAPRKVGERDFKTDDWEKISNLCEAPLAEMDEKAAEEYVVAYRSALRWLEDGAKLETYDPESNVRSKGISALLPPIAKFRETARVLALAIRLDIKHHRWEQARNKLAVGFGLARHMGMGETLIESLVGVAIETTMTKCLEDWIAEGGPNLYWPLVDVPRPFIDAHHAMRFERGFATFTLPALKELREGRFYPGQWTMMLSQMAGIMGGDPPKAFKGEMLQITGALYGAAEYPRAKEFLVARGLSKEQVEKMPVEEVLGRYFVRSFDEVVDETFKVFGLPVPEALAWSAKAEAELVKAPYGAINLLARIMVPSLGKARLQLAKGDRSLEMLRIVEAVRAHVAETGNLPAKLEDMRLPIPQDPISGKAFEYSCDGGEARIVSPGPSQPRDGAVLVLKLKK